MQKSSSKKQPQMNSISTLEKKNLEEKLQAINISGPEKKALDRVWEWFCNGKDVQVGQNYKQFFEGQDIARILKHLGMKLSKSEIDLMIWECDEDLDKKVQKDEFIKLYKLNIMNADNADPNSLYIIQQFLMYCQPLQEDDEGFNKLCPFKATIGIEDTLELLCVRVGRNKLDDEIEAIFGKESSTNDKEIEINFQQYLEKVSERAINSRNHRNHAKKTIDYSKNFKSKGENDL